MSDCLTYVILARKGSKRLPYKNRRYVGDKMLAEHAIFNCLGVADPLDIILGTDDAVLKTMAQKYKVKTMHRHKTGDDVDSLTSLQEIVVNTDADRQWFALVQPTSPLRTQHDLRSLKCRWHEAKRPDVYFSSQLGVTERYPCGCFYIFSRDFILDDSRHAGFPDEVGFASLHEHWCVDVDTREDLKQARQLYADQIDSSI